MSTKNVTFKFKPDWAGISPREKGKLNTENFESYVKHLRKTAQKFPVNSFGDVNTTLVAKLCNFERQVFYTKKGMSEKLKDYVREIGTELVDGQDHPSQLSEDNKQLRKLLNDAKRDLAIAHEERDGLKKQLMEAKNTIGKLDKKTTENEESLQNMIETGRRFTL